MTKEERQFYNFAKLFTKRFQYLCQKHFPKAKGLYRTVPNYRLDIDNAGIIFLEGKSAAAKESIIFQFDQFKPNKTRRYLFGHGVSLLTDYTTTQKDYYKKYPQVRGLSASKVATDLFYNEFYDILEDIYS